MGFRGACLPHLGGFGDRRRVPAPSDDRV